MGRVVADSGEQKARGEMVPAPCHPLALPLPFATTSPPSHHPPHITALSCHMLSNTFFCSFGGYKARAPEQMPPSNLCGGDGGCLPTMYFHAGHFSHSFLNYESFPINGKFTVTAKIKRYSNYPLVVVYSTVRTICSSGMLLHCIIKLLMPPEMPP